MTTTLPSALPPALHAELEAAGLDPERVLAAVVDAVTEDLPGEDVTSAATLDPSQQAWADLVARGDGVVAGLAVAEVVFRHVVGPQVEVKRQAADGDRVTRDDVLLSVHGPVPALLTAERTALNFLCHLSGVATATARWVDALAGTGARVRDTRKTTPGFRALEKYGRGGSCARPRPGRSPPRPSMRGMSSPRRRRPGSDALAVGRQRGGEVDGQ